MERKKKEKIELPELEREILELCLFVEDFSTICEECNATRDINVVADAIKNLIHYKLLTAANETLGDMSWIYDSDKMKESRFRATAQGITYLES